MGIPFVLDILDLSKHLDSLVSLRYFRLVRVFRVLKLQKQTIAVALFVNTIRNSAGPLMVLMFFVMMAIVVFGSIVYSVEHGMYCPPAGETSAQVYEGRQVGRRHSDDSRSCRFRHAHQHYRYRLRRGIPQIGCAR